MRKAPCKGCERRNVTCHEKCEDYLEWKKEHEKLKEKIKEEKLKERGY